MLQNSSVSTTGRRGEKSEAGGDCSGHPPEPAASEGKVRKVRKKVVQILLILCLVLTLVSGGCAQPTQETPPAPTETPAVDIFIITARADDGGEISPSGETEVEYGTDQTFTITADSGSHIADVLVDGKSVGAVTSYTFQNVTTSHTISATFAIDTFAITATTDGNGEISPSGEIVVEYSADQTFTIIPNPGYHITDVFVDGKSIGAVTSYTFQNVTDNHTIDVTFAILDSDEDGMSDWFEENIAKLDPSVKNERYLLFLQTAPAFGPSLVPFEPIESGNGDWYESRYIVSKNKFKPENITELYRGEATRDNFEKAISEIARKVNKSDIVYIQLIGHGSEGRFQWMSYQEMNETFNQIKAKAIIVAIIACFTSVESLAPLLKEGSCPRIIMAGDEILSYNKVVWDAWKNGLNAADLDKNGYISIKEGWLYKTNLDFEFYKEHYDQNATYTLIEEDSILIHIYGLGYRGTFFFDPNNIGNKIYLGDANIEDLKRR